MSLKRKVLLRGIITFLLCLLWFLIPHYVPRKYAWWGLIMIALISTLVPSRIKCADQSGEFPVKQAGLLYKICLVLSVICCIVTVPVAFCLLLIFQTRGIMVLSIVVIGIDVFAFYCNTFAGSAEKTGKEKWWIVNISCFIMTAICSMFFVHAWIDRISAWQVVVVLSLGVVLMSHVTYHIPLRNSIGSIWFVCVLMAFMVMLNINDITAAPEMIYVQYEVKSKSGSGSAICELEDGRLIEYSGCPLEEGEIGWLREYDGWFHHPFYTNE